MIQWTVTVDFCRQFCWLLLHLAQHHYDSPDSDQIVTHNLFGLV